jgi:hypothetical protein
MHQRMIATRTAAAAVAGSAAALVGALLAPPVDAALGEPARTSVASVLRAGGLPRSPELVETSRLRDRRAVAIGDRAYSTWTEDGLYPAMGFHTRGEMGGVWAPPVKLLDGLWFGVEGLGSEQTCGHAGSPVGGATRAPSTRAVQACGYTEPMWCPTVRGPRWSA